MFTEVNTQYKFSDIASLSRKEISVENIVIAQYELMKKSYTFEVVVDGEKVIYSVKGNDWKAFFKELEDSGHFNGFQSHHVFVVDALKKSEGYRKWYDKMV
ncbi:hypothetical protein PG913_06255 [Tenacibaculum pacificus]|uniref:hypothetical protein n=1 Tax=Tenacibaculum pacificus TaxID=3018314 RepID=UPI0022F40153|nr:hypothetical protein [Tenacibaculum pacificus]WBX74764.1 hypothetical protein PG913_06255 [Tenacibaculum pacificus]